MGEYFDCVNDDRKEYISPGDFGLGNKLHESMGRRNAFLCALKGLLSREWAGDHVIFMGEESSVTADAGNEALRILYGHTVQAGYPGETSDTVFETYKNISALFQGAEGAVRQEIRAFLKDVADKARPLRNEYGVDISDPYRGLFRRTGLDFRYTINHTRRVCYSFEDTKVLYLDHTGDHDVDPQPVLMSYGRVCGTGAWAGDIIGVGDEAPDSYELLKEICLDW